MLDLEPNSPELEFCLAKLQLAVRSCQGHLFSHQMAIGHLLYNSATLLGAGDKRQATYIVVKGG